MKKWTPLCCILLFTLACGGQEEKHSYTNALVNESSPYLLQHAHNPVNWYPWGEEALQKAEAEGKMLIISVGYAACHWCHVMEHESFEDTTVARLMNEHFINIKVDREERPDVDNVYMTACQLASERGCGWPLNAFALPDGRPVWAGTYFPKKEWLNVMEYFIDLYAKEPAKLEDYAQRLLEGIQLEDEIAPAQMESDLVANHLDNVAQQILAGMDKKRGGRQGAPKFPMPIANDFLLRQSVLFEDEVAQKQVFTTLDNIARGGIYDQLRGGFARYSTDADWKVPHFEKMLYDNGQLVALYAQAYQIAPRPLFAKVIRETLDFVERELGDANGGFYSSLDADSEGEEGKFYIFTEAEIDSVLAGQDHLATFKTFYNIQRKGNWEEEQNILHITESVEAFAAVEGWTEAEMWAHFAPLRKTLMKYQNGRIRPGLDDKQLTAWNALLLSGYVEAYRALGDEAYREKAVGIAQFITQEMMETDGKLWRNHKDGKSVINAFLDDYALATKAFIDLYQITFEETYLRQAEQWVEYAVTHFSEEETGLFWYTSDLDPALITRKKETADNVIPGSNSVMARNLLALGQYLDRADFTERGDQMLRQVWPVVMEYGATSYYANWANLYQEALESPFEIAILGPEAEQIAQTIRAKYLPQARLLGGQTEGSLALLKGKLQPGDTFIYVCRDKVCKLPVQDPQRALEQLSQW